MDWVPLSKVSVTIDLARPAPQDAERCNFTANRYTRKRPTDPLKRRCTRRSPRCFQTSSSSSSLSSAPVSQSTTSSLEQAFVLIPLQPLLYPSPLQPVISLNPCPTIASSTTAFSFESSPLERLSSTDRSLRTAMAFAMVYIISWSTMATPSIISAATRAVP